MAARFILFLIFEFNIVAATSRFTECCPTRMLP